jgi:deoxyxylulose-5-phosphate synthase
MTEGDHTALTGGMAWEARNNIAAAQQRKVVIVVIQSGRSYSPPIGGVAERWRSFGCDRATRRR